MRYQLHEVTDDKGTLAKSVLDETDDINQARHLIEHPDHGKRKFGVVFVDTTTGDVCSPVGWRKEKAK